MSSLMKTVYIPTEQRLESTLATDLYYDKLDIYEDKVIGYLNGSPKMTWEFKYCTDIKFVKADIHSQFAKIEFHAGKGHSFKNNSHGNEGDTNKNEPKTTNRILLCNSMFGFDKTNDYAFCLSEYIKLIYEIYRNNELHNLCDDYEHLRKNEERECSRDYYDLLREKEECERLRNYYERSRDGYQYKKCCRPIDKLGREARRVKRRTEWWYLKIQDMSELIRQLREGLISKEEFDEKIKKTDSDSASD